MSEAPEIDYTLQPEKFQGEITINNQRVAVSLTVSADAAGQLSLDTDPIPHSSEGWPELIKSLGKPGYLINEFGLDCKSSSGKRLTSDRAYLTDFGFNLKEYNIYLGTVEARLSMKAYKAHDRPVLCFYLLGFKCFSSVQEQSKLGLVKVQGATRAPETNKITGSVAIQAADSNTPADWRQEVEHLLWHLRLVLGFANGASLPVPVTEFYEGDHVEVTFCNVDSRHLSYLPPLSHVNLSPIIKIAIDNIRAIDEDRQAFERAINWLLIPTTYNEVHFLTGMIALESLASRFLEKPQKSILGESAFKKLARCIRKLIDEQNHLDSTIREDIKQKLPELNRRSLGCKIDALLERWNINRKLIDDEEIKRLIDLRNAIIHEGIASEYNDLLLSNLHVREILVRLVFAMLKFDGVYQCYINGFHHRHFPSCKKRDG